MLKEELTQIKDKLHKTENSNNCLTDERELLNRKEMETLQEAIKKLWVSQNTLESATKAINYEERRKNKEERRKR